MVENGIFELESWSLDFLLITVSLPCPSGEGWKSPLLPFDWAFKYAELHMKSHLSSPAKKGPEGEGWTLDKRQKVHSFEFPGPVKYHLNLVPVKLYASKLSNQIK